MRTILYGFVGVLCVILAAASFILVAAPTGLIRDRMIAAVEAQTGRTLSVAGDTSFTVYPSIGVKLADVSLSNPPAMADGSLISMSSLDVAIPLLRLMQGEIVIERLVLREPVVSLTVDRTGARSWDFASAEPAESEGEAGPSDGETIQEAPAAEQRPARPLPSGISLGDVRIEGGIVRYRDERSGSSEELTGIDMSFALADLSAPLGAEGSLTARGDRVPFKASVASLAALLSGDATQAALTLTAPRLEATFDGELDIHPALAVKGRIATETRSLRNLVKWAAGSELPGGKILGATRLEARIAHGAGSTTLSDLKLALDGSKATGTMTLTTSGARPHVKAELSIDRLDIGAYLGQQAAARPAAGAQDETASAGEAASQAQSLEGAAVSGEAPAPKARSKGWSRETIDLAVLRSADADVSLQVGKLAYAELKASSSELVIALKDGLLKARVPKATLYKGRGIGTLVLDSRTGQPRIEGNATVSGVSALPLLKDAAGFDWIAGKGEMSIGIKGAGESARDIVESLIGQGRFSVEDGSIVGIDIAKAARGLTEGRFSDLERVPSEKTDFSELSGTFTISGGIASNDDLRMQGPLIRMTGAGTIDLPARSLDYLTRPKLVASLEGQGGAEASGLEVPVRIHGSWDDPKLDPDLKGVLQNPGAALQTVEGLAKKAGGSGKVGQAIDKLTKDAKTKKKLQGLLDNVLGGGEEAEAAPGQ